ncbi:extracellular serine/threonine protein kinase four-jointed [Neocloeon triangulifer]|uniref:extracellular serine/threonine protein kinase four-jointed n=1 Tax=Neocloeon triangulifer TaxID=2078957 RepID=UPI00286F11B7|nr:extracellular serine/threonine protein kinase four-jointed [Neocloeon triangulifer]XP_059482799.1 extracellular serine/threonine protein kinase four-jointed [Neocloeon triangulifer]
MYDGGKRHKHTGAAHLIRSNLHRMCASGVLPSWYAELQHKLVASNRPRYFRLVCICTATSAFVMGIIIGLMIPMYLLPPSAASALLHAAGSRPLNRSSSSTVVPPVVLDRTVFDTVSFVPAVQQPPVAAQPSAESTAVNSSLIANGVYWSDTVEMALPQGYDSTSASEWRKFVRKARVIKMEEGCGRMQNRLVTFDNGSTSCCRYRQNVDQIQGEIFGFYLGRYILGLPNLTPTTLSRVKPQSRQWASVKAQVSLAQWATEEKAVVMTKFVPLLLSAYIPTFLRPYDRRLHPPDVQDTPDVDASELAQWSDLVVFDYLTANMDRMINNMYNLQWNPTMMDAPAHNLAKDASTGLLLFLDNESGLLHGYRLLDKYEHYHKSILNAVCIFRRSTADAIKRLYKQNNVGELLRSAFKSSDPEFVDILPSLPEKNVKILNKRIARVHEQIVKCESMYKST